MGAPWSEIQFVVPHGFISEKLKKVKQADVEFGTLLIYFEVCEPFRQSYLECAAVRWRQYGGGSTVAVWRQYSGSKAAAVRRKPPVLVKSCSR